MSIKNINAMSCPMSLVLTAAIRHQAAVGLKKLDRMLFV